MKLGLVLKRLLSTIVIVLALKLTAWAQPSLIFEPASPEVGEQFCIEVTVKDFTDILSMEFSLGWNPNVLQFDGVQGFGLPNLTAANFDQSLAAEGKLSVDWVFAECSPSATGFTILEDGTRIFELCFTALGEYGATSPISLTNDPTPIDVQRVNACPNNIGMLSDNGLVSVGVRPLTLIASQEEANEGDLVCVDFSATGFDDLTSMQFSVNWDPNILQFDNVVVPETLVNLAESSFGTPLSPNVENGNLIVSWSFFDPNNPGVSLPDSTEIFQVCYRIIGECETSTDISFSDSPRPFEFTNAVVSGFRLTVQTEPGEVQVGDCDPTGLQLFADCGEPVNPNEEVCVQISTAGFSGIREFNWNLEWNENILEFIEARNFTNELTGFNNNDLNTANVSNGVLGVSWETVLPSGATLPGGQGDLMEVCFRVVGVGGGSPISFNGSPPRVINSMNNNIGINPSNCAVEVNSPDGIIMTLADSETPLGDTTCVGVTVANFTDILTYQFSMAWQPNHAEFIGIENINLPEATLANFGLLGVESGSFTFQWTPSQAHTVPDNTVIFDACFEMIGDPQDCQDLSVVNEPLVTEATSSISNGNDIGVTSQSSELCILFPEGFFLDIAEVAGDTGTVACVPVEVTSFDDITSTQFTISWEPSALQFDGIQNPGILPGLTEASFNTTSADVGLLEVSWNGGPETLPDSSNIFDLCFNLVGNPDSCYQVRLGEPTATVTTVNGDGSILSDPGEVCIRNRLFLVDTVITPVSCPGSQDGSIIAEVVGGNAPLGYTWETIPATTPQFGPQARNLPPGLVTLTVFDNSNPSLVLRDTFEITLAGELPNANAGEDQPFVCDPPIVTLEGQGSEGPNFSYRWTTVNGRLTPDNTDLNAGALAPGSYVLIVTNDDTGCSARDTVQIIATNFPTANAGFTDEFPCDADSLMLDGSASSSGASISYRWTARNGGMLQEGQDTLINPIISSPGRYILAVTNNESSCVARDTVEIVQTFPNADAGADQELSCDENSRVILASQAQNSQLSIATQWLTETGDLIVTDDTLRVNEVGTYILRVTNATNNCSSLDTVSVTPSPEAPQVNAGDFAELTCVVDTVTLNASISNSNDFTFEWQAEDGGSFVPGTETSLSPQVAMPGTYRLTVIDTVTNCRISDLVQVALNDSLPTAEAGMPADVTCQEGGAMLDGTGSSVGEDFAYTWTLDGQVVATDTLQIAVETPGNYFLEVLNNRNGCTAIDSVMVGTDADIPEVILPIDNLELDCNTNSLTIEAQVNNENDFSLEWSILEGGNIISSDTTLTIEVDGPGTYQLRIRDNVTGCEGVNEAVVLPDSDAPVAMIVQDTATINCLTDVIAPDAGDSSIGSDFTYQWSAVGVGTAPSPSNALETSINVPGTYELLVTDVSNGCVASDTIVVLEDRTPPTISIETPDMLSCTVSSVMLDASASTPMNVSAVWTGGENTPDPTVMDNQLVAEATQGGTYILELTNNDNGCVATDSIQVMVDPDRPQAFISEPAAVTCTQPNVTLDATESSVSGDFSANWTTLSGNGNVQPDANNPLLATANGAGTYQLTITRTADGCESTVQVELAAPEVPMASAVAAQSVIGCGETTTISSAGSSTGANIMYEWSVVDGSGSIANPMADSIQVSQAGTYQLLVTNTENGCTETATASISFDIQFDSANAGADVAACEPNASLTANLPAGTTGRWTSMSGATIDDPTSATISVSNLTTGDNFFMWTLSADGCQDYSTDEVNVKLESAPIAADDALTLKAGETSGSVLVSGNDATENVLDFTVTISQAPTFGTATAAADGRVTYNVSAGVFGQDEFSYTICSANCPTLCDSAFVQVLIEEDPNFQAPPRNNAITPNGDGLNETMVFDELLINPEQYPDNELIIFNRWGDIVYQVRNYNNQWDGTNEMGQNLPEGTYYYILRLNISEGIIIRGDVTIVR